jgi:hypothetical protein
LFEYIQVRFGKKKDLLSKIGVMLRKYQMTHPLINTMKSLAQKLCTKNFFNDNAISKPNVPCIVADTIYLGNSYFSNAENYSDEEKVLICMACYYIRNASYPKEFEVFLTLIQMRIFNDMGNINQNHDVDNVIALF